MRRPRSIRGSGFPGAGPGGVAACRRRRVGVSAGWRWSPQVIVNRWFILLSATTFVGAKREVSVKNRFSIPFSTGVENASGGARPRRSRRLKTRAGVGFRALPEGREPAGFQQPRTAGGRARFLTMREGRPSVEGCRRNGGTRFDEAHLSTQSSPPQEDPRIPCPDEHAGGPAGAQSPPCEGPPPPDGLPLAGRRRVRGGR